MLVWDFQEKRPVTLNLFQGLAYASRVSYTNL